MGSWNSRGLRGSMLEEAVNFTNEKYSQENLALVQKIPTPITPIEIDKQSRHITLAYFEQKSTVDYIGAVQGIPVLMRKSVGQKHFRFKIYIVIRWNLWLSLKSRMELLFFLLCLQVRTGAFMCRIVI